MYIVENRVFFTCGRLNIDKLSDNKNLIIDKISNFIKIESEQYWFNRFSVNDEYIKFSIAKLDDNNFFNRIFDKNIGIEKLIENVIIKIHSNGITSTELYFKLNNVIKENFDDFLDDFSTIYTENIFKIVFEINEELEKQEILSFPSQYKYGTLVHNKVSFQNKLKKLFFNMQNENNQIFNEIQDSYLLRVHYFTENLNNYSEIKSFYDSKQIQSKECNVEINKIKFQGTLFWAFVLWSCNKISHIEQISQLLDIDSYTMNEIVIYNVASDTYTNLMYKIDFNANNEIKANDLFEMYKVNGYFLQKNKLSELSFSENVNNFVTEQRKIEKFDMQEQTFINSEKKFLDIYNAVETNEKSNANRIIQYILTALTLLTIISVSKDIIEFIKAEFYNEQSLKIDIFSRNEFLALLLICIVFLFLKLRQYINKI